MPIKWTPRRQGNRAITIWAMLCAMIFGPALSSGLASDTAQCPPAGSQPNSWCAADKDLCTSSIDLPAGFTVDQGQRAISLPGSSQPVPISQAVKGPGQGGLCCGVVATVSQEGGVQIYRAWAPHYDSQSTPPKGYAASWQFGNWWSADRPDEVSQLTYRTEEDICMSWDSLTVYSVCTIPQGTQVFIGPGQSACCPNAYLLESSALQIYVPNSVDPATGQATDSTQAFFADCETFVWPRASN